jgi:hypothetical protein
MTLYTAGSCSDAQEIATYRGVVLCHISLYSQSDLYCHILILQDTFHYQFSVFPSIYVWISEILSFLHDLSV